MADSLRTQLERRLSALRTERAPFVADWTTLAEYVLPWAGRFGDQRPNRGERQDHKIVDPEATYALRTLTSGLMSGLTSPSRPWFRLATHDPDLMEAGGVKEWLGAVESAMRRVFSGSNTYRCLANVYRELGLFGTAAIIWEPDREDFVRGHDLTAGEYLLACDPRGAVDTIYREMKMTVAQIAERFGLDGASTTVRGLYDRGQYDTWVDIVHAVEPNRDRNPRKIDAANKAWRSVWWEAGGPRDTLLRTSGIGRFPVTAPRWDLLGGDTYGHSPAGDALGDVLQLQHMARTAAKALDKMIDPPMQGPNPRGAFSLIPGSLMVTDGPTQGYRPMYEVQPRLQEFMMAMGQVRDNVRRGMYADLFLMMVGSDRREMTAREVSERHEEKLIALGPVLERLQNELLGRLIDTAFDLMVGASLPGWMNGGPAVIPPPPEALAGLEIKVDYISMLAQAQQAVAVTSVERFVGFVGNLAGARPDVLDKVDLDQVVDEYGLMTGVPPKIVVPDEQVRKLREARAQAQQQQQATQQAMQMGLAGAQGAKVLSDTDVGGGQNALQMMLGAGGAR